MRRLRLVWLECRQAVNEWLRRRRVRKAGTRLDVWREVLKP